ncbi:hypothetical protein [Antribacter gilvus]|uniref:hypothetical protein n=1 Tax=Antribacter gilvus TaxID=2304675 RepID=UPI003B832372
MVVTLGAPWHRPPGGRSALCTGTRKGHLWSGSRPHDQAEAAFAVEPLLLDEPPEPEEPDAPEEPPELDELDELVAAAGAAAGFDASEDDGPEDDVVALFEPRESVR